MDNDEKIFWKRVYFLVGDDFMPFVNGEVLLEEYASNTYLFWKLIRDNYILPVGCPFQQYLITDKFREEILEIEI